MLRALAWSLAAIFALTAQTAPSATPLGTPPAPSASPAATPAWTVLSTSYPDLSFHFGCISVPTLPGDDKLRELVYFKNDSDEPYELDAGFSPDGTTAKVVNFHLRVDAESVAVTFFGFLRPCGADKTVFWSNVASTRAYFTPQATPSRSAIWLSCTLSSHSIFGSNGTSMVVDLGRGGAGTYAYEEKEQTLLAYDPRSRSASQTGATFLQNDVTWFYATAFQYDLNRKTLSFTRSGSYQEESNLVTPPDTKITDNEAGACQRISAPPLS